MSASASKKKRKELEEQGLSPRAIAAQKEKEEKQKTLRNVLIVALCIAVAAAAVFAVISLVNRPSYDTKAAVATVGDEKITVPVYDIFYNTNASSLYNYGYSYFITGGTPLSQQNNIFGEGTMEDFFKENASNALQTVYNYYIEAKKAGYKLTDEQQDRITEEVDAIKTAAKNYGFTNVNKFLNAYYGKGCTLDDFKTYLEVSAMYEGYRTQLQEEFEPSVEELQSAYDKDPTAYDLVSYTYAEAKAESTTIPAEDAEEGEGEGEATEDPTAATEQATTTIYSDEAKAAAKETADSYVEQMPEDANSQTSTKASITSSLSQEIADWLYDAERKEGDAYVFARDEDGISYYTVRFDGRDTNDYQRINANILTITKDKEDAELEEGQQTSEQKLEALLAAVKAGMTDEEFSEAASALGYTVSTSAISHTDSVEEIRNWLYDETREAGDLLTDYASDTTYYVVRYVGAEETSYRDVMVKSTLWNEKDEAISTANTIQIVEDMMQYATTDLTFNSSSSES